MSDETESASADTSSAAAPAAKESESPGMGKTVLLALVIGAIGFVAVLKWPSDADKTAAQKTPAPVQSTATATGLAAPPGGWPDFNDAQIAWKPYEEGLALAKKEKKPILLVIHTDWCPHCRNYRGVFRDPRVVEQSKQFVMINVNQVTSPDIAKKYEVDGEYIPRTYFLSSEGVLDPGIKRDRPEYKYFYDERKPESLLSGMTDALKKLQNG